MNELKLADLGEGMHEAEIVEWLVRQGESVRLDQPVVRVETDKAIVEIPSPVAGQISEIRFQAGQTAKVGEVLAVYENAQAHNGGKGAATRTKGAPAQASSTSAPVDVPSSASAKPALAEGEPTPVERFRAALAEDPATANGTPGTQKRVLAAPAVRKLAFELGIDLASVMPSAANGRVTLEDVRAHTERANAAPAPALAPQTEAIPASSPVQETTGDVRKVLTGLRRQIAEHMERSWRIIPHATAFDELDASGLIALRKELLPAAEKRGTRLTYMPLLIKLLIPVLKEFPIFNASLDQEKREIVYKSSYHMGVATASPDGLFVPVLRDADTLSLLEIAARLEKLIEGAKTRTLTRPELTGSTFTLNNVGSFGGSSGTPIINYPEVAILAIGRIEEKAVVRNGAIIAQPRMPLALSFDHRVIDGALSGAFLARFKELVEHPQQLLLDMI
ncbi:MAG TPA: dihydrolipoamide acetyltransferase family protein [Ktedonobacteraceae bacterium]|nr:dihydrolipoamide acetyltransferase family protein [Ktedonobacteraceae bacterium]